MSKVYVGDIGTEIVIDCGSDLTGATVHQILVRKKDGTTAIWEATVDGNYLKYTIVENDLNIAGTYWLQAYVSISGWSGRGATATLVVYDVWK